MSLIPYYNLARSFRKAAAPAEPQVPVQLDAATGLTATVDGNIVNLSWVPNAAAAWQELTVSINGGPDLLVEGPKPNTYANHQYVGDYSTDYRFRLVEKGNGTTTSDSGIVELFVPVPAAPSTPPAYERPVPDKAALTFEPALTLTNADFTPGETLVISGRNFRSTDNLRGAISNLPDTASMYNRNGYQQGWKLRIEDCVFDAPGRLLDFLYADIDIEVVGCFFFSNGYCTNAWGANALGLENAVRMVFEHNYCQGVAGPVVVTKQTPMQAIVHRFNRYVNIAASTGPNPTDRIFANYLKLIGGNGVENPGVRDYRNEIITDESNVAKMEDTASVINFRGTPTDPWLSYDNMVYRTRPVPFNAAGSGDWSGSGVMIESPDATSKDDCSANGRVYLNRYVGNVRAAVTLMTGNNIRVYQNRVIFARRHFDNTEIQMYTTGIGGRNNYQIAGSTFNNVFEDNYLMWKSGGGGGVAIDTYTPTDGLNHDPSNPEWHLTDEVSFLQNIIAAQEATLQDEENEWLAWRQELEAAGIVIGPTQGTPPVQLEATQEFAGSVSGNTVMLTFQPDSRGRQQEIWVTEGTTPRRLLFTLPIDDFEEAHASVYSSTNTYEHRTLGDGAEYLDSDFTIITVTTPAAPVVVTPSVSYTPTYTETNPDKLTAKYALTFSQVPNVDIYLNITASNGLNGADETVEYKIPAGTTSPKNLYYNYTYAELNPDITEVVFQISAGTGYTSANTARTTHALNYTPPAVPTSLVATGGAWGRSGIYQDVLQDSAAGYSFKPSPGDNGRDAFLEWNLAQQDMPTTLKLYITNYDAAGLLPGTIKVYALGDFDPATATWANTRSLIGAELGSVYFDKSSPYVQIPLGQLAVTGRFGVLVTGEGFNSSTPYIIARVDSANAPTLAETVVANEVNITSYGAVTSGSSIATWNAAIADVQATGKTLLIDAATNIVVPAGGELKVTLDDVKMNFLGKITATQVNKRANDWRYQGILDRGTEYDYTSDKTKPDYTARMNAYDASYRVLTWTGKRGQIIGVASIDGGFDNTVLSTWGSKTSPEVVGVFGDGFKGKFYLENAGGSGVELTAEGADVEVECYDPGYTGFKPNIGRDLKYMKVSFIGGKTSTVPTSRSSCFTMNGTRYIDKVYVPVLHVTNGSILFEGVVGNTNTNAFEPYFKELEIVDMDITCNTEGTYEWGAPASFAVGKLENVGSVTITKMKSRGIYGCSDLWCNLLAGPLVIQEKDSALRAFRPAPDTTILLDRHVRDAADPNPAYTAWYNVMGNHKIALDVLEIQNNGYGDMPSTFGIFNIGGRTPVISIKTIDNVGGAKIPLARFDANTGSGCIKIGTGLTVAQQLSYLASKNIYVSSSAQRLLAAS